MIRSLVDAGLKVHVVYGPMAADWSVNDPELGRSEPWDVPLLEGYSHEFVQASFTFGPAGFFCLRPLIKKLLQRLRPEAVWIHGWGDIYSVAAWNAAWQLGIPVMLRGESHLKCLKGGWIRRWLHRQILTRCFGTVLRFLAIGSANREFYLSYGVPSWKIVDVPYAVDNERFLRTAKSVEKARSWRRRLGIAPNAIVVGFVGKQKAEKRPDLAVEAVAACAQQLSKTQQPWLLFVGGGPLQQDTEALARKLYPSRTRFLGFQNQSELPALYNIINILVLPSDFEPWGLVANEAMSAGCPVVLSDRTGAAIDLISPSNSTGRVFKAGSVKDLQRVLLPLLQDREALDAAGIAAENHIKHWSFAEDRRGITAALDSLPPFSKEIRRAGVIAAYLGVHQIFQMAAAAAESGRLEHFYCSLIAHPGRWGAALKRWFPIPSAAPLGSETLPPNRVTELPLPLIAQRILERVRAPRKIDPIYTNSWFGRRVAKLLPDFGTARIVVAGETCALEVFAEAKRQSMQCILDCHGIPAHFLQTGIDRAAAEFNLPAPRLLDSPAMTDRKILERGLADVLVLCSDLQKEIYSESGQPESKLRVVPLWIDTSFWKPPERKTPRAPARKLRVMFAGAGSLAKGLPYLLRAIEEFADPDIELSIIGAMQPELVPLLNRIETPVHTHPYCPRTELRNFYWTHDVFVMPSLGDSFGFVALEAMACGLPVVVTDRCGAPVPDPTWRVPAFSSQAITERLNHYSKNRSCLDYDGDKAADFAKLWTSDRYRKAIRGIYADLDASLCEGT